MEERARMSVSKQSWFLRRTDSRLQQIIMPLIAASLMLSSSCLPWLNDPLGKWYSAWSLPVDIGWQFHIGAFNYGLLCVCCAVYASLISCASWRPFKGSSYFRQKYVPAALLCLIPIIIFLLQYLFIDMHDIDLLTQHKIQAKLISDHLGYGSPSDLIPIRPFYLDTSTVVGRAAFLVDQVAPGIFLPLISGAILLDYGRLFTMPTRSSTSRNKRTRFLLSLIGAVGVVLLLRGPAGLACAFEAKASLSSGQYAQALAWLDAARTLNPNLDQVAYYHRERGEALYYLDPERLVADSHIYLAYTYRVQGDYLDSYVELLGVRQSEPNTPWVVSEMSVTLEGLAEFTHPLRGPLVKRPINDDTSLPWAQSLTQVDDSNVYGHYLAGRIDYNLHNFTACMSQMTALLRWSSDMNEQSSAYTYLGLSEIGLGNEAKGRELLLKAVDLDPSYRNNTAREEISGLR